MSRYRKVDPRIWNDAEFRQLSDSAKLLFLFLLTHPYLTMLGAMRATGPGLAAELGWIKEDFEEAFQEVLDKGMAEHDSNAFLIWLPNFLKYNRPESPNVVKAWGTALDLIPECQLKDAVVQSCKAFAEGMSKAFAKAIPEAFEKAMPNQEQKQEQTQEIPIEPLALERTNMAAEDQHAFDPAWSAYPKRAGGNSRTDALKAWRARLRNGYSVEQLVEGTRRYAAFVCAAGQEGTKWVMQAKRFYGTGLHFLEAWAPPNGAADEGNPSEIPSRAGFS